MNWPLPYNLAFLINKDIEFNKTDSNFLVGDFECMAIELKIRNVRTKIINIYRPPKGCLETAKHELQSWLNKNKGQVIVIGDANVDALSLNYNYSRLVTDMSFYGLNQLIDLPTRTTPSLTCVDHIWTNINLNNVFEFGVIPDMLADHMLPFIIIKRGQEINRADEYIEFRNLKGVNMQNLKNELKKVNWDEVLTNEISLDNCTENFIDKVSEIMNLTCPIRKFKVKKSKTCINPWMSKGLLKSRQTKISLITKALQTGTQTDIRRKNRYIKLYNKLIKEAKNIYYQKGLACNKDNPKKTWEIIGDITKTGKRKTNADRLSLNLNGKVSDNQQEIADYLNNYYTNVANELAGKLDKNMNINDYIKRHDVQEFKLSRTSQCEIINVIGKLKNKKSSGVDGMSNSILKKIKCEIAQPLTFIINRSITEKYVPILFKVAKVVPIYKNKGSKFDPSNYRPVSLLSTYSNSSYF